MRTKAFLLSVLVLTSLVVVPALQAQDRPLLRFFFGERAGDSSDRESSARGGKSRRSVLGGPKRVEINLTEQTLHAYEGNRMVLQSQISSGRGRITPTGSFRAGPYMAENHYSSLFDNAHMPWSVQVQGNIFIHGFAEVPDYPASRGCIRLPITGRNPAKQFYEWVEPGTPIRVFY